MDSFKKITHNTLYILSSNVINMILGILRTFIIAGFLTPAEYGVFNMVNIVISYINYVDIGTNAGMLYRSSELIGVGRINESKNIRKQALLFTLVLSAMVSIIAFILAQFELNIIYINRNIFLLIGVACPIILCLNYFNVEGRLLGNFRVLGLASIISGCGVLAFTILFIKAEFETKHVELMVVAGLIGAVLSLIFLIYNLWVPIARKIDWHVVRQLIHLGIPLSLFPIAYTLFQSIDRWVIVSGVSGTEFGYYAFGTALGMMITMLPNSLGVALSSQLIQKFGKSSGPKQSSTMIFASLWVCAYLMAFISGIIIIAMPYLLNYFFQKYLPGIGTITTLAVANCILFSIPVGSGFLLAIGKLRICLILICIGTIAEGVLVFTALHFGGIEKASYALLLSDLLLSLFTVSLTISAIDRGHSRNIKRIIGLFFPFLICILIGAMINNFWSVTNILEFDAVIIVKSLILYLVVSGVVCALVAWACRISEDIPINWKIRNFIN